MYTFARAVVGPIYKILFRIRVSGLENIPSDGGVILCANHTSNHDTVVLAIACPRNLHFLAKKELFKFKFLNKLFVKLGAIPVDREKPGMESLKRVVKVLTAGKGVGIFMQGGRRKGETDAEDYKAGVALFAIKGKAAVVPVNISSSFRIFSKVDINIGKPINFEEFWDKKVRTDELNEAAQKVMDAIVALGGENLS